MSVEGTERPVPPGEAASAWGSDAVAQVLRGVNLEFVSLNPGASYRGLHDSLVNRLGNHDPQIILCLHEEHALAIAHGYAKATGRPMGVALHSNVGLMHGSMGLYNAWCDRVPMIVLGATGPVDAAKRRPWIDWIHTSRDQGALIRNFVKWDDQPASVSSAVESLLRASKIALTPPYGPVYVCLDASVQEERLREEPTPPNYARFRAATPSRPSAESIEAAVSRLRAAKRPLILSGRGRRDREAWDARIALAERLGAKVLTDLKSGAFFPTDHPLHPLPPFNFLSDKAIELIRGSDVILSLDSVDLAGVLSQACDAHEPSAFVISASVDLHAHNGWSMDLQALPAVDLSLLSDPDTAVSCLLDALGAEKRPKAYAATASESRSRPDSLDLPAIATELRRAIGDAQVTFAVLSRGWPFADWPLRDPLDYLGKDGGSGLGSGPGLAIGAALALRKSNRLVVAVLGDGDCAMGMSALWTAAHYKLPVLFVVANNRSYRNDELHQAAIAEERGRPTENSWIGQRISDPGLDFAKLAEGQGVAGFGPARDRSDLSQLFVLAAEAIRSGRPALIDVHIETEREQPIAGAVLHRQTPAATGGGDLDRLCASEETVK